MRITAIELDELIEDITPDNLHEEIIVESVIEEEVVPNAFIQFFKGLW